MNTERTPRAERSLVSTSWSRAVPAQGPDFHQRIVKRIAPGRIDMRADASDDAGQTWRKDLDYIFQPRRSSR